MKLFNLKYIAQKNKQTQGFRKIRSFCYKIRIFDGCLSFEHFARHQGETLRITRTHPAGAKNMHGDPIFLLQFLNVLYMAGICVKFEKNLDSTSFSSDLYTLRVLRLDSQKSIHNLDPKKNC